MKRHEYDSQIDEIRRIMRNQFMAFCLAIVLGVVVYGIYEQRWLEACSIGAVLFAIVVSAGPLIYAQATLRLERYSAVWRDQNGNRN